MISESYICIKDFSFLEPIGNSTSKTFLFKNGKEYDFGTIFSNYTDSGHGKNSYLSEEIARYFILKSDYREKQINTILS